MQTPATIPAPRRPVPAVIGWLAAVAVALLALSAMYGLAVGAVRHERAQAAELEAARAAATNLGLALRKERAQTTALRSQQPALGGEVNVPLARISSTDGPQVLAIPPGAGHFVLQVGTPPRALAGLIVTIEDGGARVLFRAYGLRPDAQGSLVVVFPVGAIASGRHAVVLNDGNRDVARYTLDILR
jgi:hypothetical protein